MRNSLAKVEEQFLHKGFVALSSDKTPSTLLWSPDLVFGKDGYRFLVLLKSNNSVPPNYLQRIANVPKGKINVVIIFGQRAAATVEDEILALGIGIGYFIKGRLSDLKIRKKQPLGQVKKGIKKPELPVINIFISSVQKIEEREFVRDRLETQRLAFHYPFGRIRLIEYEDYHPMNDLYKHIREAMDDCHWIIFVLSDTHSKVVRYELYRAIRTFKQKDIFIFVRSTEACSASWKNELKKVKALRSIKYVPYSHKKDLEITLFDNVKTRMAAYYKQHDFDPYI